MPRGPPCADARVPRAVVWAAPPLPSRRVVLRVAMRAAQRHHAGRKGAWVRVCMVRLRVRMVGLE